MLLQVLFYAEMAKEQGTFSIDDVLDRLSTKLINRHPHVFGEVKADTSDEVKRNWEALKAEERKKRDAAECEGAAIDSRRRIFGDARDAGSAEAQLACGADRI